MLRVNRISSGPLKGKFEKPSSFLGHSAFSAAADIITDQIEIIAKDHNMEYHKKTLTCRKLMLFLTFSVLAFFICVKFERVEMKREVSLPEYFNVTEVSKLNPKYKQAISLAEDNYFTKIFPVMLNQTRNSSNFTSGYGSLRVFISNSQPFAVYQKYVMQAVTSAGLTRPQVDEVKMFLEGMKAYRFGDHLERLRVEDGDYHRIQWRIELKPRMTVCRGICLGVVLLLALYLRKLIIFVYLMKVKWSKDSVKRFISLEAPKFSSFGVAVIPDNELNSLTFVCRNRDQLSLPGGIPPAVNLNDTYSEMTLLNSSRYI